MPAAIAARVFHVFPEITTAALTLVNALLPGPGGIGKQALPGRESKSALSESFLTALTDSAARRNNEVVPRGA